jgi:hypothetical protein
VQNNHYRINPIWGEFKNPEIESTYRRENFSSEKKSFVRLVVVCLTAMTVFAIVSLGAGFRSMHPENARWVQAAVIAIMAGCVFGSSKIKTMAAFRIYTLTVITTVSLLALSIPLMRPADYSGHYITDVVLIYSYYIIFPISLRIQIIPAVVISAAELIILATYKTFDTPLIALNFVIALALANVLGFMASRHKNIQSREGFARLKEEETMHDALKKAREKADLLEELIPICSSCKNIRNDDGYWEQVEGFLLRHADMRLTHGMCPDCMVTYEKAQFGEEMK